MRANKALQTTMPMNSGMPSKGTKVARNPSKSIGLPKKPAVLRKKAKKSGVDLDKIGKEIVRDTATVGAEIWKHKDMIIEVVSVLRNLLV